MAVRVHHANLELADRGAEAAFRADAALAAGVNTYRGHVTCEPVATSQDRPYQPLDELL